MLYAALHVAVLASAPLLQDALVPSPPRLPLPRPAAGAPMAAINQNLQAAGRLANGTLTLSLDVVEAAWQPEGPADPVVPILAFAERGQAPQVPGPMLRVPAGTTVHLTLRNRADSALVVSGLRFSLAPADDTLHLAPGQTRELRFTLDSVGTFFYWGMLRGLGSWRDREWLDSQLNGALIVDPPGAPPGPPRDRVWVVTEWFHSYPDRPFESALVFNGRAWPHNERLTLTQGDSVHWRIINAAAVPHPMHLHGFYFRVTRRGGERADTVIAHERQALQNMQVMEMGGTLSLSWVPTTPGNWVFHCHFASHVGDHVSLHGSPDPHLAPAAQDAHHGHDAHGTAGSASAPGGHEMRGLVIGMHVTPSPEYREPVVTERRTIRLLAQQRKGALVGQQRAYGFYLQEGDSVPPRDAVRIPGPILELRRGEPVRIVVRNNMDEPTGVHWHGLEIESFPDGVPGFSGIGDRIMPPIAPGDSFVAEFTPPRSGTFPYHSHLHEMQQIGSGMYGALLVTDAPRDTLRDHVIVAGGGGPPIWRHGLSFLMVNGRMQPPPITMVVGDTNRLRIVSIHADFILGFRLADSASVATWEPIARDGADLPPALQSPQLARVELGPGETADYAFVPTKPGRLTLEVWMTPTGQRVALPIDVRARESVPSAP